MQDVMPTTLELAGAIIPNHVEFHGLLPLIENQERSPYDAIYGGYMETQRMVCDERWKLILYPQVQAVLLFDRQNDPLEMHNVAEEPENVPIVKRLFEKLLTLQETTGDTLDLRATYAALAL